MGATFAAFFVAQRLKSEPPVIDVPDITTSFSPNGDGNRDASDIAVSIKVADDATVDVVNLDGDRVRRLVDSVPLQPNRWRRMTWDGKGDDGRVVPDGQYRLRVALRDEGRSAIVQKTMTVDTRAPRPQVCIGAPCGEKDGWQNVVSQGDRAIDIYTRGRSRFPTIFRVFRTDQGKPKQVAMFDRPGRYQRRRWDGLVEGKPLDPGVYLIQAQVRDTAGNRGVAPAEFEVGAVPGRPGLTVRGISAQPPVRPVTAGGRAEFFVDARGAKYRWRVRRVGESRVVKRNTARDASLVFRAPEGRSGVYLLELRAGRWSTTVPFLVQAKERAKVLVVVPTLSWLGSDKIDDTPFDGLPNTLATGDKVRWPRMYAGEKGLPAGFADDIAPLLVFLDRRRIRYDLTSDIDLDLTRSPRATDREGVLLAGSMTWITRPLGQRLRKYVNDGGKLAIFGSDTLLRGVRLRVRNDEDSGTLERPTQPAAADPFGARVAKERRVGAPATLVQYEPEDTSFGLMEGALDLPGFTRFEEAASLGKGKVLAAVGQPLTPEEELEAANTGKPAREIRSALSAVQLGKGTVIRVGLPEWPQRLDDPNVAQVTRNIYDILRGVQPRIRSEG
ncbi:hypothetical protein DVA67_012950 [Solirubrobacter sp. CPCC 204708]|uniref:N,N-dimethylformamidase beta subunit-like C-terminal domain-containing protein n=1 Tax=Solirubrobacter deserti TaxID=2282478 RepID=A0ABT4RK18_9ACTN|nr:N,N-dimethylformamidase beta subunit family domain-containing protein [Solirubrobacter deserti]MBE2316883.1 hypothetical protein [Solirubrobacter deserti]MDA0138900.1 hypothetical protein [Solirubrobacter deserti]